MSGGDDVLEVLPVQAAGNEVGGPEAEARSANQVTK